MSDDKVLHAISKDLDALQRERRRHFAPALGIVLAVVAGAFVMAGLRNDLLEQPTWQLGVQIAVWLLCLVAFPAIGLGLVFPSRATRIALALGAVTLAVLATTGWPLATALGGPGAEHGVDGCLAMIAGSGAVLLGLGVVSGAFVQRTRVTGVYWVAAGLALAALNMVTWVCPATGLRHVLPGHLGGGLALLIVALVAATFAHRHGRARPHAG